MGRVLKAVAPSALPSVTPELQILKFQRNIMTNPPPPLFELDRSPGFEFQLLCDGVWKACLVCDIESLVCLTTMGG